MSGRKIAWIIILSGLFYWVFDSIADSLIFREGTIISLLIFAPTHEIVERLLTSVVVMFAVYLGFTLSGRKKAEEEVRNAFRRVEDEKAKSEAIIAAIGDGITIQDRDFKIIYQNQIFISMLGNHIGEYCYAAYEGAEHTCEGCPVAESFKDGKIHTTVRAVLTDQGMRYFENTSSPLRDSEGSIIAGIEIVRDITARKEAEERAIETSQTLQSLIEASPIAITTIEPDGIVRMWNPAAERIFGWSAEEVIGRYYPLISEGEDAEFRVLLQRVLKGESFTGMEVVRRKKDGALIDISLSTAPFHDFKGDIVRAIGLMTDITERKKAEEVLREVEQQQKAILNNIPDIAWLKDSESRFVIVNEPFGRACGVSPENLIGKTDLDIWPRDLAEKYRADDREVMKTGKRKVIDEPLVDNEGKMVWIATIKTPIYNGRGEVIGTTGIARDITERKNIEDLIKASLREKEVLLQEIHHRVKNNLQVISSILNLQSGYVKDDHDRVLFMESRNRIKSMALIHEKLYRSRDLAKINIADYIRTLTEDLMRSYKINAAGIRLNLDIQDILLDIDTAVPLGLIVNELISNSLKYAFPRSGEGEIGIALILDTEGMLTLTVRDNGTGLPEGLDFPNVESLGLQLVKLLTEQIGGSVELKRGEGTTFNIVFKALERHKGD